MNILDKEEFQIKLDEINQLVEKKDYKAAMEIVDSIDWRRVKNIKTLCTVGEIYAVNKRYKDSREIFLLAYHRSSVGKSILYRLIEVSIKMGDLNEALEYYTEFRNVAPNDSTQYVLKYKIYSAKKAPIKEQIAILEKYKSKEYTERWAYELAKLYFQAGDLDKCTETCDDMVIWFGDGKYVNRALDIKSKYTELTPSQQRIYNNYINSSAKSVVFEPKLREPEKVVIMEEDPEKAKANAVEELEKKKSTEVLEKPAGRKEDVQETDSEEVKERKRDKKKGRRSLNRMEKAFQAINNIKEDVKNEIFSENSDDLAEEEVAAAEVKEEDVSQEARSLADTIESISQAKPVFEEADEEFQKKVSEGIKNIFQMKKVSMNEFEEGQTEEQTEEQTAGQINMADIIPDVKSENQEDIPYLEPEEFYKPPMPKLNIPKVDVNQTAKVEDLPVDREFSFNLEDAILTAAAEQGIEVSKDEPKDDEPEVEEITEETAVEEVEDIISETEDISETEETEEIQEQEDVIPEEIPQEPEEMTLEEKESAAEETAEDLENLTFEEDVPSEVQAEEMSEIPEIEASEEAAVLTEEEELMQFIDEQNQDPDGDAMDIVPRADKLDDEEIKLFKYFADVPGMKEQLVEVLKDTQIAAADKTSNTGNVIIMGNRGSGKTMLFEFLIKAICRELKLPAAKMAKIEAEQFNKMDIPKVVNQLSGGFLLIQNTNQMTAEAAESLNQAMEFRTDGLTVILEDEKIGMRKFIARNEKLMKKFTSRIAIPVFTNDELVNFAKIYTTEKGYKIEEMAILALYTLISNNQKEDEPMTVEGVRTLLDNAIARAESGTRKIKRNLSKTRTDRDGLIILYEKDFK